MARPAKPVAFPVAVLRDTREQLGYAFGSLRADRDQGGGPLRVLVKTATLASGDYSLAGFQDRVAVERKSKADLFGTLGRGRDRFVRELERLAAFEFAAVVVEAEWSEVLNDPPPHSRVPPKTVFRSVLAWQQRYPRVHWLMLPGRAFAEAATFRVLQRFLAEFTARHPE